MKVGAHLLLLLVACSSSGHGSTRLPWRLAQSIRNATTVEVVILARPARATVTIAGGVVLDRRVLDDSDANVAKTLALTLVPCPVPCSWGVELPTDESVPIAYAFLFHGTSNTTVVRCSGAGTIEGLGQWLEVESTNVFVGLASSLFPDCSLFKKPLETRVAEKPPKTEFERRTGRMWPIDLPGVTQEPTP